jgi:predicted dienelactone hydrolase
MTARHTPLVPLFLIIFLAWNAVLPGATDKKNSKETSIAQPGQNISHARELSVPVERELAGGSSELEWFDSLRSRQVPVKIYYPVGSKGPFPVVLFSHGLGRSREDCAYLGTHWASRGYVTVFIEHVGSDQAVWRDQRQPMKRLKEAYDNPATMRNRPQDMLFALNQLEKLKRNGGPLAARIDLTRVGAAGCDLGAETALALAGQVLQNGMSFTDRRIRAVVAMSPTVPVGQVPIEVAYQDINVPCLYMTGTEDDGIVGQVKAYQRRWPFDNTFGADQYLAIFQGGDHMIYAGHIRQRETGKDAQFQPLIRDASTLFWDAYLADKPESLAAIRGAGLNAILGRSATIEKKLAPGEKSR